MPNALPRGLLSWRVAVLALLVGLIVVVPFVLVRQAARDSAAAADALLHTREVEGTASALTYQVRDLEAATLALANGIDAPLVRARIARSLAETPRALERLARLTRDNPSQQLRVGALQANISQRLAIARRLVASDVDSATARRQDEIALVLRYPVHPIIQGLLAEEDRLERQRTRHTLSSRREADALVWGAMLAQLLLLGAVSIVSQRHIASREAAEQALLDASARAQAVMQTVREPIVLLDAAQRVVLANTAFCELYEVDSDDVLGKPLAEVGTGAWNNTEVLRRLHDVLARSRELWDYEHAQRTPDGIERTMLLNARQMALPDRTEPVVLVTVSDITSRKASEQRIRELNRQLEGKVEQISDVNRELEAFSYSVSHDLRAPLRHIAGFADKLARQLGPEADEKSRHYLDVIGQSARRMSTLIDDLLVYSRLGRSAVRLQAVDLQSMVADVRAMLDANARGEQPDHVIEWRVGTLPMVAADENMMRQVWQNLLGNAVKYSSRREPAVIEVAHRYDAEGNHHFTVADNGAGFDMAYAGKLFGVFQRMHKASDYPGTGIGLASVRRVLLRHGGRIWAEAEPDKGATFHFTLPAMIDPTPATDEVPTA